MFEGVFEFVLKLKIEIVIFSVHFLEVEVHFLTNLVELLDLRLVLEFLFFQEEALFVEFLDLNLVTEIIFKLSLRVFKFYPKRLDFDGKALDFNGLENNNHIHSFREIILFIAREVLYAGSVG